MTSNNSSTTHHICVENPTAFAQDIAYAIMGTASLCANLLPAGLILTMRSLRQRSDVTIYCGLLVADAMLAFGLFCQGIKRSWLELHRPLRLVSAWFCMNSVPQTPIVFGRFLVAFMFLSVSTDRLYSACRGQGYAESSKLYPILQLSVPYTVSILALLIGWYLSSTMPKVPVTTELCVIDYAYPTAYNVALYLIEAVLGLIGCCIHVGVYLMVRNASIHSCNSKNIEEVRNQATAKARRQTSVSKLLAAIALQAFAFCVCPALLKAAINFADVSSPFGVAMTPYLGLMTILSTLLNGALYCAIQKDLKREAQKLLRILFRSMHQMSNRISPKLLLPKGTGQEKQRNKFSCLIQVLRKKMLAFKPSAARIETDQITAF